MPDGGYAEPTAQDLHWAHTMAWLFAGENGGDLTSPQVPPATRIALEMCEERIAQSAATTISETIDDQTFVLPGDGRLRAVHGGAVLWALDLLATVKNGLAWAARPGILRQAHTCSCGVFQGSPPPSEPGESSESQRLRYAIWDAAAWAAGQNPRAAQEWVQHALTQPSPGPAQTIYDAASLLADTLDQGNTWTREDPSEADADVAMAQRTLYTLMDATRDREAGLKTAADALNALWHDDPARHYERRRILLHGTLLLLGGFLLDRARDVAFRFDEHGGGDLTDPAVRRAARGALFTFDKHLFANMRGTERVDESTYLLFVTEIIQVDNGFEWASRYAGR